MITNTSDYLMSYADLIDEAIKDRRNIDINTQCKYGIEIIDSFLGGILPSELVVVGADPGVGKSELAYSIAIENAKRGKKVLLLSLEGDLQEIALRHMQREINAIQLVKTVEYRFNLRDVKDIEYKAYGNIDTNILNNLYIYNKKQIPDLKFVKELIEATKSLVDMIVIDHLHYIHIEGENENRMIGEIMRELKTITDIIKKPIILMSHLRKRDTKQDPEIYDLYGSSNVSKEATTILLISKLNKDYFEKGIPGINIEDYRYSGTKISIRKSRIGLPLANFELLYDRYLKKYVYGSLIEGESSATNDDNINFIT